jgi:cobalt-zinc-cadmium efflux system outer membrane protein
MTQCKQLGIAAILLLGGCVYHARERADPSVCELACHPYDPQPPGAAVSPPAAVPVAPALPGPPATNESGSTPGKRTVPFSSNENRDSPRTDVRTVAFLAAGEPAEQPPGSDGRAVPEKHLDLNVPPEIPGSEARRLEVPKEAAAKQRAIQRLFPDLPPLPAEPIPMPGPNGRPYTLADLQQIAAANSPQLRQAAADVEAARGNMIQANAYPNPTVSYQFTPSNNGSTPGADGVGVDQTIKTGGKLRLQKAAAEMDLHNAELALHRARSDLATQVRSAYFAVLAAKETVRVNKALAHFTDEVYRLQANLLAGGFAAPYEPAALRAQAYSARLAYKQAIQTYIYSWKQLVAAINVRQLPLSQLAGRVDSAIPYYDFDAILAYVLRNHTDVLTARNGIDKARYNLKLAQVTPVPDVDVNVGVYKDYSLAPKQMLPTLTLGVPIPIWDHNKGAIIAAEGALVRAEEEPHRVELNLTNTLAAAYMNYKNNLDALEYYRRYILPDQVRAYRGAYDRRQIDPNASFGDVVGAQQTLASDVTTYLQTLGQVWTSVTSVADLIQTDDLFEFARPEAVPPLPDLEQLAPLPCCHPCAGPPGASASPPVRTNGSVPAAEPVPLPEPLPRPVSRGSAAPAGSQGG